LKGKEKFVLTMKGGGIVIGIYKRGSVRRKLERNFWPKPAGIPIPQLLGSIWTLIKTKTKKTSI